jgi:histidinol-phosphate aminotransferase
VRGKDNKVSAPEPKPSVLKIVPYVGGRTQSRAGRPSIKLSANETPFGPSPKAVKAYEAAAQRLHIYPDGSAAALREALGRHHGIDPNRIVCGNGSDELLHLLAQAFLGPGDAILHSAHGFLAYPIAARAAGAEVIVVPERAHAVDVEGLLARLEPRVRLLFVANPNCTGTYLAQDEVLRLHRGLPPDVLLVLDAAYAEYVERNDYDPGFVLASRAENVVMTRTFSKVYGLAAARLGWAYCPLAVAEMLNRIRVPFNTSTAAQEAGLAALADQAHVARSVAHNREWRPKLAEALAKLGIEVVPSVTNFLVLRFPKTAGKTAAEADAFLDSHGLLLRRFDNYGLPDCLRLTVGMPDANMRVIEALTEFMGKPL